MAVAEETPVGADVKLKRFLYTSNQEPKFVTGDADLHGAYSLEIVTCISEIVNSQNPELLLNIIEIVNSENLLSRRETMFFVLSSVYSLTNDDKFKHKVLTTFSNLIKDVEDICLFIKFFSREKKKFPTALNKVIAAYYTKTDPHRLAEEVSTTQGYHSWTHKDLIKLSHPKCQAVTTRVLFSYILYGLKHAKTLVNDNLEANQIIDHLSKIDELKRCEKEERVIELIKELHCGVNRVPSFLHHSQSVWEALLDEIKITEIISYLPKFYKNGFLKFNPFQCKLIEKLTNVEIIEASKIHPIEIFIGLRNFERGGKPMDPKLAAHLKEAGKLKIEDKLTKEIKCPSITNALYKALQISYKNPQVTGRRVMITIDVTDKMDSPCLSSKNVYCLDAAVILSLSILKVERDVTIAVFNGNKISTVYLEKHTTFHQALLKLRQAKSGFVMQTAVFEWALHKKKQIDLFINFVYFYKWYVMIPKEMRRKENPINSLKTYRKKMCLPHAKLITYSLCSSKLRIADGSPNILDICGFDKDIPKVIQAFSKGLF